ncbi:MAG: SDR family NAD(P)-dependent oxidoreductase, partial [Alphaproteobacteria bacterium]
MDDLRGKRVLVTGASTGIGAAVARGFGAAGAVVAVHYNASEAEAAAVVADIAAAGGRAVPLRADVDYGTATAFTTYGTNGVKVWIFKGEILEHDPMAQDKRMN